MENIVLVIYDFPDGADYYNFKYSSKEDFIRDLTKKVEEELTQYRSDHQIMMELISRRPKLDFRSGKKKQEEQRQKYLLWKKEYDESGCIRFLSQKFAFLGSEFSLANFMRLGELAMPNVLTLEEWFQEYLVESWTTHGMSQSQI